MRARVPIPRKAFGSGPDKFEVDAIAQVTRTEQLVPEILSWQDPTGIKPRIGTSDQRIFFRGSAPEMLLSDVEHPLLKKQQRQHCEPENVTRNLGVKCLDYMSETIFLICWCPLQHDRSSASLSRS